MIDFDRNAKLIRPLHRIAFSLILLGQATASLAQAPIIQPGAPGAPVRELSAEEAIRVANTSYSPDDVKFMQDMIPHHHQALEMAALVADRTNRPELLDVAGASTPRSRTRSRSCSSGCASADSPCRTRRHAAMHTHHTMAGMATPEQMAELAASRPARTSTGCSSP
jgi:uncharacterized protein (DUF305 family)